MAVESGPLAISTRSTAVGEALTTVQGFGGKWFVARVGLTADSTRPTASATPAARVSTLS